MPKIKFHYTAGGETFTRGFSEGEYRDGNVLLSADITKERICVRVTPSCELRDLSFRLVFDRVFADNERFLLNGWQSWTDTYELCKKDRQHSIAHLPRRIRENLALASYGDEDIYPGPFKRGVFHGWSYAVIRCGEAYTLYGSAAEAEAFTAVEFDTADGKITFTRDLEGLVVSKPFVLLDIRIYTGSESDVYDAWFSALHIRPRRNGSVRGYTSWYRYYQNIDSVKIQKSLESASDAGMDIFQIDDGFETAVGDWLTPDSAKFPDGMAEAARRIHEKGMRAGLWLAPFVCETDSDLYRTHPDWLLCGPDGQPVKAGHNWSGSYALDLSKQDVLDYIALVLRTVLHEWNYDLVKLDFLYAAAILPGHGRTRGMEMNAAMNFLRELAGDKEILACGVPLASVFGVADYCRIGTDVTLDWQNKWYFRMLHREHASTKLSILNSAFRFPLNGRAFCCDPDVFILREGTSLTESQKEVLSFINHIRGSLVFTSDDEAEYGPDTRLLLARHEESAKEPASTLIRAEKEGNLLLLKSGDASIRIDLKKGKFL